MSALESTRESPKLVRVSPNRFSSDVSSLLCGTPPHLIQRPVRSVPLVPPARRMGTKDVDTGGSNGYVMAPFGLQKLSSNGAIFVAPQGLGNGWGNSGGQDLRFVDDMVKLIDDS